MHPSILTLAALTLALGGCSQPSAQRASTEQDARAAQSLENPAGVGGGPAGQTPDYGSPGAAPSQVTSSGDAAGPSAGEGSAQP